MWADVVEIVAFKRDLFTYDEVCLGFRIQGGEGFWPVGEDDLGFDDLLEQIDRRFPGIRADWREAVVKPPFQENWARIWCRPNAG